MPRWAFKIRCQEAGKSPPAVYNAVAEKFGDWCKNLNKIAGAQFKPCLGENGTKIIYQIWKVTHFIVG